ncbi:MAG TPA: preprotein translocase subunit SecY [Hungateiclostridium thermocellum]|jgi:preprotein translocase subunit SecY|uniref:Protein translocase subunit SecY n=2 Tax=Acetivibrio thermocellus TaxID=1515 RepID=A3DJJ2_ACET2|nr:preprotein translocase subunit SecY [Acetivibrio thermocellus]CDG37414.1 Protein translocase subunit SecY [Acetivibrio thermocellus BC1]ABN54121.1 preprotein translocase, SecY subunit [Acetivibrio thermocellus ATCC 27405]ADU73554.1 preprotein translocase, SecY subunit [Acetivibrio thermocellus DSM 1313]ALX07475.1 Protein translocase subunit SecY [Acetivibrio thermocellus AD2]ANV75214.1 Protein translocase subunit SecY [Acetivibrio thermocellus DSM 2360]
MGLFTTIRNAWKIADLRKKMFFTLLMIFIFRLGSFIPVPGLNPDALKSMVDQGTIFGFFNILSGGAFENATIFAMSITPYINASIIIQLLTVAIPKLEALAKEGEEGRKAIAEYTRYGAVVLGFLQATAFYFGLAQAVNERNVLSFITITLTFTAGTAFLMWLGEQITEYGIGNGISLLIFAGIVSRGPRGILYLWDLYRLERLGKGILGIFGVLGVLLLFVVIIASVVWVDQAERRIPVQYAKRVVGRKMYGGQSTHIPIKVNMAGVLPIIFATSFVALPATIVGFFFPNSTHPVAEYFRSFQSRIEVAILTGLLIIFFTFFYTFIQFNPVEVANNLKKNGGFIPGIRPGKPTSDYIYKVVSRISWFSALFLAIIQILPSLLQAITGIRGIWFAGTSVLILVGVALETVKQIESQMIMRHYRGFLE